MIGKTISHFRIESELGRGGMGVVYKARDTKLDIDRALKFINPDMLGQKALVDRFLTEARTLASVQHPNICPIQEIGEEDGQVFIAMSYLEGKTLQEVLRGGPLGPSTAVRIIKEVVSGLRKAHGQGVIHRDIKPGNVMLTEDGRAVIMDFGLAKQSEATALTLTGSVMGTVAYMSPEQARGVGVDHRSDLWSVGVMLYEMLTGRLPFEGETQVEMLSGVLEKDPAPVSRYRPQVTRGLEEVVERLLEKDPGQRYADAEKVLAALEGIPAMPEDDATTAPLVTGGRRFRLQRWQRRRLVRGMALGSFVAAVGALVLFVWPGLLVPTAAISAIAVMPLTERMADSTEAYYAEGVTDELITSLSKMRSLTVISRSSAEAAKARYGSPEEIARHLRVQALMEGTVQREGERLRMTVQLVRAGTGEVLWADSYERPQRSVYALQSEIAKAVGTAIAVEMTPEETAALAATREIDPKAYEALLLGRFHMEKFSDAGLKKAIEYYEAAIAIDPDYAEAHAELAITNFQILLGFGKASDEQQVLESVQTHLQRALALDPNSAAAHLMAAGIAEYDWDWKTAVREFELAVELDPSYSKAWDEGGWLLSFMGQPERAVEWGKRGKTLDPLVPMRGTDLGVVYAVSGFPDKAIAEYQAALELDPDFFPALICLGQTYIHVGRFADAIDVFQRIMGDQVQDLDYLAVAYAKTGRHKEAEEMLSRLEARPDRGTGDMAVVYTALGQREEAVREVLARYEQRDWAFPFIFCYPGAGLTELRSDPRLQEVFQKIGLPCLID